MHGPARTIGPDFIRDALFPSRPSLARGQSDGNEPMLPASNDLRRILERREQEQEPVLLLDLPSCLA